MGRGRREDQRHPSLRGSAVALAVVAPQARGDRVLPRQQPATGPRKDVVHGLGRAAAVAAVPVARLDRGLLTYESKAERFRVAEIIESVRDERLPKPFAKSAFARSIKVS